MIDLMFDIDGTLVESFEFDEMVFVHTIKSVTGLDINRNWEAYPHVTDTGLIQTFCEANGLLSDYEKIHNAVKNEFVRAIRQHLTNQPLQAIKGAIEFVHQKINDPNINVSFATGGWGDSARLKLASAGFEIGNTRLCSSNDAAERTEIMRLAQYSRNTIYFGDAAWDKKACAALKIPFVAVGERVEHEFQIKDFSDRHHLESLIEKITQD